MGPKQSSVVKHAWHLHPSARLTATGLRGPCEHFRTEYGEIARADLVLFGI